MANNLNATGVSTTSPTIQKELTIDDLAPNNYLTIVWKDVNTGKVYNSIDYSKGESYKYENQINNALNSSANSNQKKTGMLGQNKYINTSILAKYISQNTFSTSTQKKIATAVINLASGSPSSTPARIASLAVNAFGSIANTTAKQMGLSDPQDLFSSAVNDNSFNALKKLANNTQNYWNSIVSKLNGKSTTNITSSTGNTKKQYVGLLLGITKSDTESYDITIPRRKVEDGSDYTTHLLPQPYKKDLEVKLTNKVLTQNFNRITELENIEKIRETLIKIAQSRTLFDCYFRLSDTKMYKRGNVSFSSLSITKDEDSGDTYNVSMSIEPINNFKTKVFISSKKFSSSSSSSSGSSSGSKSSNKKSSSKYSSKGSGSKGSNGISNRVQKDKSNQGRTFKVGYTDNTRSSSIESFTNLSSAQQYAKSNGYSILKIEDRNAGTSYLFTKDVKTYTYQTKINGTLTNKSIKVLSKSVGTGYTSSGGSYNYLYTGYKVTDNGTKITCPNNRVKYQIL